MDTITRLQNTRSKRISSYNPTGGNKDHWVFAPHTRLTIAEISGAGCIRHIWMTIGSDEPLVLRKIVLRMYWDGEAEPSVECPIGDFFGLGHATTTYFSAAPLQMFDRGFNCWFSLPFSSNATITVEHEGEQPAKVFFYIDYQELDELEPERGRFHAQWRRQLVVKDDAPVQSWGRGDSGPVNLTGAANYVMLDAEGRGQYVGCHLNIDTNEPGWWGEGDDMFFIDGEVWPPSLHGTGTEDYFGGAWNYNHLQQTFCTPYFGYHFKGNADYTGKHSMYRYHIQDPVYFQRSLLFSLEHGHANNRSGDWTSVSYWYQTEPHKRHPTLLPVTDRLPYRFGGYEFRHGKDRGELPTNY